MKIFRRMRSNFLKERKVKNYLLYAAGEILLVMIGILLALQVNNWNDQRKNRNSENKALHNLINEFDRNHKDIVRVHGAKKKSEIEIRGYLQSINSSSLSKKHKSSLDRPDIGGYTWNPTNPILNSLLNTGKLDHLKNDSLKLILASWNDIVEDYIEQQNIYNQIDIPHLFEYENKNVPLKIMTGDYTLASTNETYLRTTGINELRENIVDDLLYHNQLTNCVNRLYIQVMSAQEVIQISEQIQQMLKSEVKE